MCSLTYTIHFTLPSAAGDLVWTDGRCAYGNYQEAQQPQVIISPDDTGFPILNYRYTYSVSPRYRCFYSFQKNKVQLLKEIERPKNLTSSEFARWESSLLINDKSHAYLHSYITSNIDNQGNIFVLAEIYKVDKDYFVTEHKAVIFKSDKSSRELNPSQELKFDKVREIDLLAFFQDNVMSRCAPVEIPYAGLHTDDGDGGTVADHCAIMEDSGCSIFRACIEDENNFDFLVGASFGQVVQYSGDGLKLAHSGYEGTFQIKNDVINLFEEAISSGTRTASSIIDIYGNTDVRFSDSEETYYETTSTNTNPITCSAGDGFYYTVTPERIPELEAAGTMEAGGEYRYNFFAPNGFLIADFNSTITRRQRFCAQKVKGGYLISISTTKLYSICGKTLEQIENVEEGREAFQFGGAIFRYSIATDTVKMVSEKAAFNDRFRTMKKIKNWHKRIKEIKLDLDENQEAVSSRLCK